MALKKLSQFVRFDAEGFFANLILGSVGRSERKDFETGEHKGTKVEVVIIGDKHNYKTSNGEQVNNVYEKITVKVPEDIEVPMNSHVRLVNVYATVYGQYRNQLSVTADDIEVIKQYENRSRGEALQGLVLPSERNCYKRESMRFFACNRTYICYRERRKAHGGYGQQIMVCSLS